MKEPHTAFFVAPTGEGKTHLALSLLETDYMDHFDFIVIICPTLRYNSTCKNRSWVWNDPDVIPIEPGNQLYYLIERLVIFSLVIKPYSSLMTSLPIKLSISAVNLY